VVWKWVGKLSGKVRIKPFKMCRSLIESVYSYFKQRMKAFSNNITSNPLDGSERFRRSMLCWELLIRLFILYYNHLRR